MPKIVTPAMQASLNENFASEPIIIIGISWGSTPTFYGTKVISEAGVYVKAVIKSIGEIVLSKRADNSGSTGSVDVEFYDTDGEFKLVIDVTKMEGTSATIFQHFNGLRNTDWFPLLHGRITRPRWTEGNRVFTCTIESAAVSNEVGYAPVPEDFQDLSPQAYGVPWPLLFGSVEMSPCIHIRKHTEGLLKTNIQLRSDIYKLSADKLRIDWVKPEDIDVLSYFDGTTTTTNIIYIKDGNKFPQNKDIKIVIDNVVFEGSFSGDNFTCTAANLPLFENVKFAARDNLDPDEPGYFVGWLATDPTDGTYPNLAGCHVFFQGNKDWYNFVVKQNVSKVWFKYPTFNPNLKQLQKVNASHVITQAFAIEPSGVNYEISEKILRFRQIQNIRAQLITPIVTIPVFGLILNLLDDLPKRANSFWGAEAGTLVRLFDDQDPDIYLISLNTVEEIFAVYGKKRTKLGTHEQTSFAPIPKSYYKEQLQGNYAILGQLPSALLFYRPLSDYNTDAEKWEDDIYVSCRSSVGANTATIIKYLLDNFTDYETDRHSFDHVASQLIYDSNFGIYERKDTLEVCREIAWQARCGLLIDSESIEIKYLAAEPDSQTIWSEGNAQFKSLEFTTTDTQNIVTRLIGTWRESNEFFDPPTRLINQNRATEIRDVVRAINEVQRREQPATNIAIHEENIDRYGVKVETVDIYIYDFEEAVQACIDFWGHRMSNVWRKVQFKTVLYALQYQIFDAIDLGFDLFGTVKCLIDEIRYDSNEKDVSIIFWTPISEGSQTVDSGAWNG